MKKLICGTLAAVLCVGLLPLSPHALAAVPRGVQDTAAQVAQESLACFRRAGGLLEAVIRTAQSASAEEPAQETETTPQTDWGIQPFYGVWVTGTTDYTGARAIAYNLTRQGYDARVYLTTDWENLNPRPWYVVTTGAYATEAEAKAALPGVRAIYADAYIKYSGAYIGDGPTVQEPEPPVQAPFYGVWVAGTQDEAEAQRQAEELKSRGYDGQVFVTTEWSNLNRQKWYVVTAGVYPTEATARTILSTVQTIYPDAYVKYSGTWQG